MVLFELSNIKKIRKSILFLLYTARLTFVNLVHTDQGVQSVMICSASQTFSLLARIFTRDLYSPQYYITAKKRKKLMQFTFNLKLELACLFNTMRLWQKRDSKPFFVCLVFCYYYFYGVFWKISCDFFVLRLRVKFWYLF